MNSITAFVQQEAIPITICLVAGIVALVVLIVLENKRQREREARYRCYIEHNSPRYLALLELNKQYDFSLDIANSHTYYLRVNSKAQLDRYNFDRFVESKIEENPNECSRYIKVLLAHREKYEKYKEALQPLPPPASEKETVGTDIPYDFYKKAEAKLIKDKTLHPYIYQQLICQCNYTSPKGRSSLQRRQAYSLDDVIERYQIVEKRLAEKDSKDGQRKAMTNSLRYDILRRDNFRCVLCGRSSADGAILHVDHIIPVAKGGKTVPENLRTLCQECNSGKRDKYDPDGIN